MARKANRVKTLMGTVFALMAVFAIFFHFSFRSGKIFFGVGVWERPITTLSEASTDDSGGSDSGYTEFA